MTGSGWLRAAIVAVFLACSLWGLEQDLPYTPEVDEPSFVVPAGRIAATGNLNPHWFGHPGSTVIYPLAGLYHLWQAAAHGGTWLHPTRQMAETFRASPSEFFLIGRLLMVAFAVFGFPLVHQIGRQTLGERAGLIAAWLTAICPLLVAHAQLVRTDTACFFFALLALAACLRLLDDASPGRQLLAGAAVGLAIATKYSLAALLPVLLVADMLTLRSTRRRDDGWLGVALGLLAVPAAFALTSPYFFIELPAALADVRYETSKGHLGADTLSPWRNLWWYVTQAFPASLGWPVTLAAGAGLVLLAWRRRPSELLLLTFVLAVMLELAFSRLHWERWLIPILPVVALAAGGALCDGIARLRLGARPARAVSAAAVLVLSLAPAYGTIRLGLQHTNPSTRRAARDWIVARVPGGSRIAQEWYTAPLVADDFYGYSRDRYAPVTVDSGKRFLVLERHALADGRTLVDYRREGFEYLVASNAMYDRYLAEADRYAAEAEFYRTLFREGELLEQFSPSRVRGGPIIRVYRLAALTARSP